jgi:hypothetical protein
MSRYQVVSARRLMFVQSITGATDETYRYQFDPLKSCHPIACDNVRVNPRMVVVRLG